MLSILSDWSERVIKSLQGKWENMIQCYQLVQSVPFENNQKETAMAVVKISLLNFSLLQFLKEVYLDLAHCTNCKRVGNSEKCPIVW